MHEKLTAVVWDFDGTLVDTRRKNMNVTRALVEQIKDRPHGDFPALRTLAEYERALHRHRHWHDFYRLELEMEIEDIDHAERSWLQFQLEDATEAEIYEGIREVIDTFAHLPQGIVSLNSVPNIEHFLDRLELRARFQQIYGLESVQPGYQKPHPEALLRCIEKLTGGAAGFVVYVGDHETDVECAHNANDHFAAHGVDVRVLSVGALYAPHIDNSHWQVEPDCAAASPAEIVAHLAEILAALP